MSEVKKKFSQKELAVIGESIKQSTGIIEKKLKNINWLMAGIVIVVFIGFVTMIGMTTTVIVDSFHINSATYKEYSSKIETQNILLETNKELLEAVKQNQEAIKEINDVLKQLEK